MSTLDPNVFTEATATIASWRKPLLISHAKPDGDALGSLAAMRSLLRSRGTEGTAMLFDAIPDRYAVFHRYDVMPVWQTDTREADLADIDGVIVLDTCTYTQLSPIADWLRSATVPKLAVDHHVTRDELADHYLIDESAAATCLILYDWARAANWPISTQTGEALFIGMAMDTGWFRHSNTDDRVLTAAADLVSRGVIAHGLHQQLYLRETPARIRLLGAALDTLQLFANDRLAVTTLSVAAIAGAGATPADTEDIVNEPLRIHSVAVSVLFVEQADGVIRLSFRSKPPVAGDGFGSETRAGRPVPDKMLSRPSRGEAGGMDKDAVEPPDVDVAKVAQTFGGGGHSRAAGARVKGALSDVRRNIVDHLQRLLPESPAPPA